MAKLCILSLSPIHQDGRVLRQIEYASKQHDVTVIGWGKLDKPRPNVCMQPVQKWTFPSYQRLAQAALMLGGRINPKLWERWYWRKPDHRQALELLQAQGADLIHVNEVIALPIAIRAARTSGVRVLFDAHEYSPGHRSNNLVWRIFAQPLYTHLIAAYAPQADAMTTVAAGIAERYQHELGTNVEVIMNAPYYKPHPFHPTQANRVRLIHHGTAIRERQLECMIDVVALADERYTLDFMLLEDKPGYLDALKNQAEKHAAGRIAFIPPVAPNMISETISVYDIGLFLIPPVNFSYATALPNKFFEFIMAGLAVAIGPSPEMARICRQYQLGIVAESFKPAELAQDLNKLSSQAIDQMKQNSLQAARALNADVEMNKLMAIYERLLSKSSATR